MAFAQVLDFRIGPSLKYLQKEALLELEPVALIV